MKVHQLCTRVFYSLSLPSIVIALLPRYVFWCMSQFQDRKEMTREAGLAFHSGGVKSCSHNVIWKKIVFNISLSHLPPMQPDGKLLDRIRPCPSRYLVDLKKCSSLGGQWKLAKWLRNKYYIIKYWFKRALYFWQASWRSTSNEGQAQRGGK